MENTEIKNFKEFCKETILDNIDNFEGQTVYACDLGNDLTQGMNCDGSFTYSRALALDYLKEWWDDAADYWNYEKDNFGENLHNPFDNPEAYTVCMVIEGVNGLMSQLQFIDKHWNDKITVSKRNINTIKKQLNDLGDVEVF